MSAVVDKAVEEANQVVSRAVVETLEEVVHNAIAVRHIHSTYTAECM